MPPKPFLIIMSVSFGIFILCAIVNGVLTSKFNINIEKLGPSWGSAFKVFAFALFLLICFSIVPLAFRFFITMQLKIGNGEFAPIKWLAEHERQMVYGGWALIILGFAIALPAAIKDGFFK